MLTLLELRDFAIISELRLELSPGLNAFTGETGAGKSILVDALLQLTGARADTGFIRAG
jgi:DNA repair protein RecN (Recombination protein N)